MATINALDLTRAMIACPSVTPEDGGTQKVLQDALAGLGFTCHSQTFSDDNTPDVSNLYARLGSTSPNFCFAGHTDVVPVGDLDSWEDDPFSAEVKDGMLYGRGAADMKSAIACFAEATSRFLENHGSDFGGSISFLITGDEEGPAINGTRKLLEWAKAEGEVLDACLVGEPTNLTELGEMIKIGRRGSLNGTLTVRGVQGHTAYPHLGDNPIHRLVKMLSVLTNEPMDDGTDHFQASTLQISTVDVGNPASNVIPAKAIAVFNIRYNDLHTSATLESWLRKKLDAVGGEYDLNIYVSGESFLTQPGPLSKIIAGAVQSVTGNAPELSTTGGTSDARFIKDYCPVAEFGPIGQTMHKSNECIAVQDLAALTDIYTAVLERFFEKSS
ncbi:MAG TPA: succinyl-diaminopimelate desuccinylase [Rhodospirillales bacterium]|nr:succinyl-diaminopimelate desuccinylase [Rhodospirillales bacterium]